MKMKIFPVMRRISLTTLFSLQLKVMTKYICNTLRTRKDSFVYFKATINLTIFELLDEIIF